MHQKCPTPIFNPHCSNSTKLIFVKFPRLLGGPSTCRTPSKNQKSVDRVSSKSRPKYAKNPKRPNLKPPYLPQIGAESPQTKTVFLTIVSAIRSNGQVGVTAQNPKVPQPPNFDPHCSNSTNLVFTKFSASLEHPRSCRTPSKNRKSDDRVPSKSRSKFAKKPNFKPPYLPQMRADSPHLKTVFSQDRQSYKMHGSEFRAKVGQSSPKSPKMPNFKPPYLPQMGADSPQTKTIFLKVARAVSGNGQFGGSGPKPQKCFNPQISTPIARIPRI